MTKTNRQRRKGKPKANTEDVYAARLAREQKANNKVSKT